MSTIISFGTKKIKSYRWSLSGVLKPETRNPKPEISFGATRRDDAKVQSEAWKSGFTLIELLIVIGIIAVIAGVLILNPQKSRNVTDLNDTAKQMVGLLRQAQSQSMDGLGGTSWGVNFSNTASPGRPFYALFSSTTFSATSTSGYYVLPQTVAYLTSTLAVSHSASVTFSPITGFASTSTSIGIYLVSNPVLSSTIKVAPSGAVSY